MLKPSHERCKTQGLKKMAKSMHKNNLTETNMTNMFFT